MFPGQRDAYLLKGRLDKGVREIINSAATYHFVDLTFRQLTKNPSRERNSFSLGRSLTQFEQSAINSDRATFRVKFGFGQVY